MTKFLIGILLLAALVGGGWYLLREPATDEAPTYSQAQVRRGDISDVVSATGSLSPINTVLVGSQVSGTIQQLSADFNDQVKQGQVIAQIDPAIFTVFAYPRRQFSGSVAQVRLQPRVEAGVVKYNCIIHVDNADLALKPGMTATVSIEVAQRDNVLTVPNAALRYVPPWPQEKLKQVREGLKTGEAILWRLDGDTLTPLTVATGIIGEKVTEVSGTNLADGMAIAEPLKRQDAERKRRFGLSLF